VYKDDDDSSVDGSADARDHEMARLGDVAHQHSHHYQREHHHPHRLHLQLQQRERRIETYLRDTTRSTAITPVPSTHHIFRYPPGLSQTNLYSTVQISITR